MSRPTTAWDSSNFRYLISARTADHLGSAIAPVALGFAILDLTGSTLDLAFVVAGRSLGMLVTVLRGGALADRFSRASVLVRSNLLAGGIQGVIVALLFLDTATIPVLVALTFLSGGADGISFPAAGGLLPQTVDDALLPQANGLVSTFTTSANLLGLVGGAALVEFVGPVWGLLVNALSFGVTALLFSRVRLDLIPGSSEAVLATLRHGWAAFSRNRWVVNVVVGFAAMNVAYSATVTVLGPAIADETVGRAAWGWILAANALGTMVASAFLANRNRILALTPATLGVTVLLVWMAALALRPTLALLLFGAGVAGISVGLFDVSWQTYVQREVPASELSRVYSYDMLGSIAALPAGQVLAGALAASWGNSVALFTLGTAGVVVVTVAAVSGPVRAVRP